MASSLPGYDAWLERPYTDAAEEAERFEQWCETHNIEFDHPDAETMYMDWIDAQYEDYEPDYDDEPDYDYDPREDCVYDEY